MYGKTLADFPDRFSMFLEVLAHENVEDINAAFLECSRTCVEFPVPAQVLKASQKAAAERIQARDARQRRSAWRHDDEIKSQRFLPSASPEEPESVRLEREFQKLVNLHRRPKAGL